MSRLGNNWKADEFFLWYTAFTLIYRQFFWMFDFWTGYLQSIDFTKKYYFQMIHFRTETSVWKLILSENKCDYITYKAKENTGHQVPRISSLWYSVCSCVWFVYFIYLLLYSIQFNEGECMIVYVQMERYHKCLMLHSIFKVSWLKLKTN